MLRNVGRSSVPHTNYIFVVDVDMMCNGNLYSSFLVLAHRLNLFANSIGKEFILFIALIFQEQIGHDILGKENAITETKLFFFFFRYLKNDKTFLAIYLKDLTLSLVSMLKPFFVIQSYSFRNVIMQI